MDINVSTQFPRRLDEMTAVIEAAVDVALERSAEVAKGELRKQVLKTYRRKPGYTFKDSNGRLVKRKWVRSNDLQNGIAINSKARLERKVGIEGNAVKPITNYPGGYAQKLGSLPVSKDGKDRSNPFIENTEKAGEPVIAKAFEQKLKSLLNF